ncbi:MAG: phosphate acetyltransferase [Lentisphaeria bacterium]
MALLEILKKKISQYERRTIVLPEGQDPRVLTAARQIVEANIANVIVLASDADLEEAGVECPFNDSSLRRIDYQNSPLIDDLVQAFYERRKAKGISLEQARKQAGKRLYFGNLMVKTGVADGLVAGSIASTPQMLRAAFHCIGTAKGIKTASSCFIMDLQTPSPASDNTLLYADCGVNPNPDAEQLVDIAMATAQTHKALLNGEQRVAFLSFSTKGSAKHELVTKVSEATQKTKDRVKQEELDVLVDGELQADAALVPDVASSKCPNSEIAGRANILIFPDLQAGNIAYKLTQRLAGAAAYGPILQGLANPINDLSRGCSTEDITGVAAITVCQAIG